MSKKWIQEGSTSDSSSDANLRDEHDPYQRKRKRHLTKEERMLGIFADDDERPVQLDPNIARGVDFVKGEEEAESSPEDMTPALGSMHAKQKNAPFMKFTPSTTPNAETKPPPRHTAQVKWDAGGKIMKMMQKMGFQGGGLGPQGQGRLEPLQPKQRHGKFGIAYGGFKEVDKQVPEMVEMELPREKAWKKKPKEERPKMQRTLWVNEITDMTGAESRQLKPSEVQSTPTGSNVYAAEIRHNLRHLRNLTINEAESKTRESRQLQTSMELHRAEHATVEEAFKQQHEKWERLQVISGIVAEIETVFRETNELDHVSTHVQRLVEEFHDDYIDYRLETLTAALFGTKLRKAVVDWEPLKQPDLLMDDVQQWRRWMTINDHHRTRDYHDRHRHEQVDMTPYETVMYHIWLPRVRAAINNEWDPRDSEPLVRLFQHWPSPSILPTFLHVQLCSTIIQPHLVRSLHDYNPRRDSLSLHDWLLPYMDVLPQAQLQECWTIVREKFSLVLQDWHPSDPSALEVLLPWHGVWNEADWNKFITKHILNKLQGALRVEFTIHPQNQDMEPLMWVLEWKDVIPTGRLAQLIAAEFFIKWHRVLDAWLNSPSCDLDQVTQWYMWWKSVFPPPLLSESVMAQGFVEALDRMNRHVT